MSSCKPAGAMQAGGRLNAVASRSQKCRGQTSNACRAGRARAGAGCCSPPTNNADHGKQACWGTSTALTRHIKQGATHVPSAFMLINTSPATAGRRPDVSRILWHRDVSCGHHLQGPHCLPSPVQGRPIPAQPQRPQGQNWTCSQTPPWSYSRNTMPPPSTPASSPTSPCRTRLHPPGQLTMPSPAPRGLCPTPLEPSKTPRIPRQASAFPATRPRSPSSSRPLVPVLLFSQQVRPALVPGLPPLSQACYSSFCPSPGWT